MGRIEAYGYPFGTYLSYMDSIPLLAIPFKLISPWLEPHFQYLGLWELISVIGQMIISMFILQEYTRSYPQKILGAALLVISPPILFQAFYQGTLTAQWILLAGIWFIILEHRQRLWRGAWLVLFSIAILVHLYFVAMLIPLWAVSLYFHYKNAQKKWLLLVDILSVFCLLVLLGYSIGLFSLKANLLEGGGFGYFSWNLNGFFNPIENSSTFLRALPLGTDGQYEGYSYLGLGNLFILPIAFLIFSQKDYSRSKLNFILPIGIISVLFILFALTNKAFLNAGPVWNISLPNFLTNLFSLFRASGRFIWPVFYFLVLFGIISIVRNIRYPTFILVLALFLQFVDIQPLYASKRINGFTSYRSPLQSQFWQEAASTNKHIIIIPIPTPPDYPIFDPISLFARQNKMTLNWGYMARADYAGMATYAQNVMEGLKSGTADSETLYLFWDPEGIRIAQDSLSSRMLVCNVDDFTILLSLDNPLTRTNLDISPYCRVPSP